MSNQINLSLPDSFDNKVRLFPLPNLVLFPGIVQALHLFEPRYRELMKAALATDQLITMAYVKPGPESLLPRPEIASTVCIGKILSHTQLEDGRYNLFLVGARRARVVQEVTSDFLYRTAEVELIPRRPEQGEGIRFLRDEIATKFRELADNRTGWDREALKQFLDDDLPFGQMIDMISYSCGASSEEQQRVLETFDLRARGELVLEILQRQVEATRGYGPKSQSDDSFPPGFSLN